MYSLATTHAVDRIAPSTSGAPPVPYLPTNIPIPARKPLPPTIQQTTSPEDVDDLSACVKALLKVNSLSPEPPAWALKPTASQQIVDPWTRHSLEATDPDSSPAPSPSEEEGDQHFFRSQAAAKLEGAWEGPLDSPPPFVPAGLLRQQQDHMIAGPSNLQARGVGPSAAAAALSPVLKAPQAGLFRSFSKSAREGLGRLAGLRRQDSSSGGGAVGEVKKRDSGMYYPNALPRKRKPSASPARTLDRSVGTSSSPSSSASKGAKTSPAPRPADPVPRTRKVVGHQDRVTQFGDFIDYASSSSGSQHDESSDKSSSPAVVDLATYQAPPPPPPPIASASRSRAERKLPAPPKQAGLGISGAGRSAAAARPNSPISNSSSSKGEQEHDENPGRHPYGLYYHGARDPIIRQIDAMPSLSLPQKAWAATESQRLREKLKAQHNQSRASPSIPLTPPTSPPSSASVGAEGLTNLLAPYTAPSPSLSSEGNPETIIDTLFHPGHTSWRITGFSDPDTIEFFHGRVPVVAKQQQQQEKEMGDGQSWGIVGTRDEAAVLMERLERERWGG
ncbi:hypothetical protein KC318_g5112 [Hortaea werneckii]|nr:hypothetical protein KC334_g5401 [Hortaea werneckii]KAI7013155.1 hypothetical protein KC355_g5150 [Hortaea werneckii]KAI7668717.1 hypothetical protein KC318_g5112 [Hortaea werneckii]